MNDAPILYATGPLAGLVLVLILLRLFLRRREREATLAEVEETLGQAIDDITNRDGND